MAKLAYLQSVVKNRHCLTLFTLKNQAFKQNAQYKFTLTYLFERWCIVLGDESLKINSFLLLLFHHLFYFHEQCLLLMRPSDY